MGARAYAGGAATTGALIAAALVATGGGAWAKGGDRQALSAVVTQGKVTAEELASGDGKLVIVPAWGARVMGVFFGDDNALWVSPSAGDPKDWNKGGARTWVGPEGHDKGFFFDKTWAQERWQCPAQLDPGKYQAKPPPGPATLAYENDFELVSNDGTKYALALTRQISPAPNPLAGDKETKGLKYSGFLVVHRIKNRGTKAIDREIGVWDLLQAKPPATMEIPIVAQQGTRKFRDSYFERIPKESLVDDGSVLSLKVAGPPRWKIGIPAARCRGLIGSVAKLRGGQWQLIVRRFPCDPQGRYTDRPKDEPDSNGDPVEGYNHLKGGTDAFYELECHGAAVKLDPGADTAHPVETLIYRGPEKAIRAAAGRLLGADGAKLKVF